MPNEQSQAELESIDEKLTLLKKIFELMTQALALVAALAWNDAIQSLFLKLFGQTNGIIAKFFYALIITVIMVLIGFRIARIGRALEKRLAR